MGRIAEILASCVAPGFSGFSADPGCPQVAVPRALRRLEDEFGSRSREMIGRGSQFSTKKLREIWIDGRKKRKHKKKYED